MRSQDWRAWVWGFCGASTGTATVILIRGGLWNPITAGWAQAIGSVAAVSAAIWIATHQARVERERHNARRRAVLDATDIAAASAGAAITFPHQAANDPEFSQAAREKRTDLSTFRVASRLLDDIPLVELGDRNAVMAIAQLSLMLAGSEARLEYLVEQALAGVETSDATKVELEQRADKARELYATISEVTRAAF